MVNTSSPIAVDFLKDVFGPVQMFDFMEFGDNALYGCCPKEVADKLIHEIYHRGNLSGEEWSEENSNSQPLYKLKNYNLDTSLAISLACNYAYYALGCSQLLSEKDELGKRILVVGTDEGLEATFLAKVLPEAEIVGIDLCEEAIRNANELRDRLQLKNINFIHANLLDFDDEKFDTVITLRTIHEWIKFDVDIKAYSAGEIVKIYGERFDPYCKKIADLLVENGLYYSIERSNFGTYLPFAYALNKNGLETISLDPMNYQEYGGDREDFTISFFQKDDKADFKKTLSLWRITTGFNDEWTEENPLTSGWSNIYRDLLIEKIIYGKAILVGPYISSIGVIGQDIEGNYLYFHDLFKKKKIELNMYWIGEDEVEEKTEELSQKQDDIFEIFGDKLRKFGEPFTLEFNDIETLYKELRSRKK